MVMTFTDAHDETQDETQNTRKAITADELKWVAICVKIKSFYFSILIHYTETIFSLRWDSLEITHYLVNHIQFTTINSPDNKFTILFIIYWREMSSVVVLSMKYAIQLFALCKLCNTIFVFHLILDNNERIKIEFSLAANSSRKFTNQWQHILALAHDLCI